MVRGESVCYLQHCSSSSAIFHTPTENTTLTKTLNAFWRFTALATIMLHLFNAGRIIGVLKPYDSYYFTSSHLQSLSLSIRLSIRWMSAGGDQMKRFHLMLINNRTLLNANLINFSADCNNVILSFMAISIFFSIEWKKSSFE